MRSVACGPDLGCHTPFGASAETDENFLSRPEFGDPETPQGFHMDEDIFRTLTLGQETEALDPVKPFDDRRLKAGFRHNLHMCPGRRQLGGMDRRALVHGQDPERLKATRPIKDLAYHAGALIGGLEAVPSETGDMQQHIRTAAVRDNKPVTLCDIKPFDGSGNLDDIDSNFV